MLSIHVMCHHRNHNQILSHSISLQSAGSFPRINLELRPHLLYKFKCNGHVEKMGNEERCMYDRPHVAALPCSFLQNGPINQGFPYNFLVALTNHFHTFMYNSSYIILSWSHKNYLSFYIYIYFIMLAYWSNINMCSNFTLHLLITYFLSLFYKNSESNFLKTFCIKLTRNWVFASIGKIYEN